jgi:hypothetical protein
VGIVGGWAHGQPRESLNYSALDNQGQHSTFALGQVEAWRRGLGGGMDQQLGGLGRVCDAAGMHCAEFKRVNSYGDTPFRVWNMAIPIFLLECVAVLSQRALKLS